MTIKQRAKNIIKNSLGSLGLDVSLVKPRPKIKHIDILSLVVNQHMRIVGEKLSFMVIGANDGAHGDPMREWIIQHGWMGVLVEPQPKIYQKLCQNYLNLAGITCEHAAVSETDGDCYLYAFADRAGLPEHATMLASFNLDALKYNNHGYAGEINKIKVPGLSVKTLLKKHGVQGLDILYVDTEGFDYNIIKMCLKNNIRPNIIQFENGFMDRDRRFDCYTDLTQKGYAICEVGIDTIAWLETSSEDFQARVTGQVRY